MRLGFQAGDHFGLSASVQNEEPKHYPRSLTLSQVFQLEASGLSGQASQQLQELACCADGRDAWQSSSEFS